MSKQRKPGRPKTVPTMQEIFEELQVKIEKCESCGATPATYRHYANGKTLCRECSRPFFNQHLNKMLGLGVLIGVVIYFLF